MKAHSAACRRVVPAALGFVVLVGCDSFRSPTDVRTDEIISVSVSGEETLADGVSTVVVSATIPSSADADKRAVTFTTDLGTFQGTDNLKQVQVPAGPGGVAQATLRAGTTPGTATVTAAVASYAVISRVEFQRALPDSLQCQTSSGVAKLDGTSNPLITAFLRRSVGSVSLGTPVRFEATQADASGTDRRVGRWFGLEGSMSNGSGQASASLGVDTGDVRTGVPVTVTVLAQASGGGEVKCLVSLRVE